MFNGLYLSPKVTKYLNAFVDYAIIEPSLLTEQKHYIRVHINLSGERTHCAMDIVKISGITKRTTLLSRFITHPIYVISYDCFFYHDDKMINRRTTNIWSEYETSDTEILPHTDGTACTIWLGIPQYLQIRQESTLTDPKKWDIENWHTIIGRKKVLSEIIVRFRLPNQFMREIGGFLWP